MPYEIFLSDRIFNTRLYFLKLLISITLLFSKNIYFSMFLVSDAVFFVTIFALLFVVSAFILIQLLAEKSTISLLSRLFHLYTK